MSDFQSQNPNTIKTALDKFKLPSLTLILNLILSHFIAIIVALIIFIEVFPFETPFSLTIAIIAGTAVGLLLLLNLIFSLGLLEEALQRLAKSQPVKRISYRSWSLSQALDHINQINEAKGLNTDFSELRGTLHQQLEATTAQEIRNRLARDLHDSIKQQIFSMNISAAAVEARWENDPEGARTALLDVRRGAKEAMAEMNALLQQLRPAALEKVGLIEAIREQCEALGYRTGAQVSVQIRNLPPDEEWQPGTQEAIFRIVQEALANIARHARATQVTLLLMTYKHAAGKALMLVIEDDGQGFDLSEEMTGMGLSNISERTLSIGGELKIITYPGHGTTIRVEGILLEEKHHLVQSPFEVQALAIMDYGASAFIFILLMLFFGGQLLNELPLFLGGSRSISTIIFFLSQLIILGSLVRSVQTSYRKSIGTATKSRMPSELLLSATRRQTYLWRSLILFLIILFFPIHLIYLSGQVGGSIPWQLPLILIPLLGLPAFYAWYRVLYSEYQVVSRLSNREKIARITKTNLTVIIILPIYLSLVFLNNFDFMSVGDTMDFSVAILLTLLPAIWIAIMSRYGMYLIWHWRIRFQNGRNQQPQENVTYG